MTLTEFLSPVSRSSRMVTAALIAGVFRSRELKDVLNWLETRPAQSQMLIIGAALALLAGGAFIAAQIGWIAMLVYFLLLIVLVN